MSGDKILVTNIQRCSLHDGPGIRTTVFTKGCLLCCPWCANPENIRREQEEYIKDNIKGIYGTYMSCDEIYNEVVKDKMFYDVQGGVTFSGGEPLIYMMELEPLLAKLRREHIHLCVETSLFVPRDNLITALRYIDLFIVDIKILDCKKCFDILKGNLELFNQNLKYLYDKAAGNIIFRIPLIPSYTTDENNMNLVIELLSKYPVKHVDLIKGHNLGKDKYDTLNREYLWIEDVPNTLMEKYKSKIENMGIETELCTV